MSAELSIIKSYGPWVFVALLIIGLAAYGIRSLISVGMNWLSKIIGRRLEETAEHYRHQLGKDLEAYKSDLSRALNRQNIKAEVRRAVAEKLLDRRLEALHEVHLEIYKHPSWVNAVVGQPYSAEVHSAFSKRMDEFSSAIDRKRSIFDVWQ
ncbi:hypothetical protein P9281_15100 [Caballeronia sp. LP003]|uniref:hypothetical protein n=1 Tax=Caballeronia sp. LP003 TaxID=3038551 RepID=UPI002858A501|nr:hypothetical protein [Caballeronia sp. LP003]MDR5787859.1 hypothetical protein [Caballeronia sp. LP003]